MNKQKNEVAEPEPEPIVDAMAPPAEPSFTCKNVSPNPLRVPVLEDGYLNTDDNFRNVPLVELDATKWVDGPLGIRVHPPKLHGPANVPNKQHVKQLRERVVVIQPGQAVLFPLRVLPALINIRCAICASGNDARGRCGFPLDPEHRKEWTIMGAALVSPTQVQIDVLDGIPINDGFRNGLEEDARANRSNGYGRKLRQVDS